MIADNCDSSIKQVLRKTGRPEKRKTVKLEDCKTGRLQNRKPGDRTERWHAGEQRLLMDKKRMLDALRKELVPAVGCTEPIMIAYEAAKAASVLGQTPERADLSVSCNVFKNAMGVGIPGTEKAGLDMAAAMGIFGGDSGKVLEVLSGVTDEECRKAQKFVEDGCVKVSIAKTDKKLYAEIRVYAKDQTASVLIEDNHTSITKITKNGKVVFSQSGCTEVSEQESEETWTITDIVSFVEEAGEEDLSFFDRCIDLNMKIAKEGLSHDYGLRVGKNYINTNRDSVMMRAAGMAAAAADARMSGCMLPVMTVCGSGNQGITATVPVIVAAESLHADRLHLLRALALSCLVTMHVKFYIGKLSPLCGCGMGSSIGVCCAIVYLEGGSLSQIRGAAQNMIADVSGIICDGAKAGCALKIGTVVLSAFQCASLALNDSDADSRNGIVKDDVEQSIRNLGILGKNGMRDTDQVILDMMIG